MLKTALLKKSLMFGGGSVTVAGTCAGGIYFDQVSSFVLEKLGLEKVTPSKFDVDKLRKDPFITFFTVNAKTHSDIYSDNDLGKKIKCKYKTASNTSDVVDENCIVKKLSVYEPKTNGGTDYDSYFYKFKVSEEMFKAFTGKTDLNNFEPDNLDIFAEDFKNLKDFSIEFTGDDSSTKTINFCINSFDFYKTADLPKKQTNRLV